PSALLLEQLVRAVVPDLDRAGPVLTGGDDARERRVLERVVLDVHGERPPAGLEGHALRDGPRREDAVPFEPEVVVEAPSVVPLDDEDRRTAALPAAERLGRPLRISLRAVLGQLRHRPGFHTLPGKRRFTPLRVGENGRELLHLTGAERAGPATCGPRRVLHRLKTLWTLWTARPPPALAETPTRRRRGRGTSPGASRAARRPARPRARPACRPGPS